LLFLQDSDPAFFNPNAICFLRKAHEHASFVSKRDRIHMAC
jgi:hypothetical protein